MIHRIKAEERVYSFGGNTRPALKVRSRDSVVFETVDARGGRAMAASDGYQVPPSPPLDRLNPVTGPVFVHGAEPGDTLLVEVEEIRLGAKGFSSARQDMGVLQDLV